jgi:hypothetical protein
MTDQDDIQQSRERALRAARRSRMAGDRERLVSHPPEAGTRQADDDEWTQLARMRAELDRMASGH